MRTQQLIATSLLVILCSLSDAFSASEERLESFVVQEAYVIAESLKLTDILKEKTFPEITAHRIDAHGIHWLSGDVKIVSRKYGTCGVALQLKFIEDGENILIVSSKGVLAALDIDKGVEKYLQKLSEYKNNVESGGHAIIRKPD